MCDNELAFMALQSMLLCDFFSQSFYFFRSPIGSIPKSRWRLFRNLSTDKAMMLGIFETILIHAPASLAYSRHLFAQGHCLWLVLWKHHSSWSTLYLLLSVMPFHRHGLCSTYEIGTPVSRDSNILGYPTIGYIQSIMRLLVCSQARTR